LLQTFLEAIFERVMESDRTSERALEQQDPLISPTQASRQAGYGRFGVRETCSPILD
jgi:hypothetical protein